MSWKLISRRIFSLENQASTVGLRSSEVARPLLLRSAFQTNGKMSSDTEINHDKRNKCFYIQFNDGGKALLEYEKVQTNVLDFYHTEVPTNQQGKGIAKHLVKEAIEYAFGNNFKVKPSCSYVLKYVNENIETSEMDKIMM